MSRTWMDKLMDFFVGVMLVPALLFGRGINGCTSDLPLWRRRAVGVTLLIWTPIALIGFAFCWIFNEVVRAITGKDVNGV